MKLHLSEYYLPVTEFNSCPGFMAVDRVLGITFETYVAVDTDRNYWANGRDTLVIAVPADLVFNLSDLLKAIQDWKSLGYDELDFEKVDDQIVIRLWWD